VGVSGEHLLPRFFFSLLLAFASFPTFFWFFVFFFFSCCGAAVFRACWRLHFCAVGWREPWPPKPLGFFFPPNLNCVTLRSLCETRPHRPLGSLLIFLNPGRFYCFFVYNGGFCYIKPPSYVFFFCVDPPFPKIGFVAFFPIPPQPPLFCLPFFFFLNFLHTPTLLGAQCDLCWNFYLHPDFQISLFVACSFLCDFFSPYGFLFWFSFFVYLGDGGWTKPWTSEFFYGCYPKFFFFAS